MLAGLAGLGRARLGWLEGGGLRRASRLIDKLAGRLTSGGPSGKLTSGHGSDNV